MFPKIVLLLIEQNTRSTYIIGTTKYTSPEGNEPFSYIYTDIFFIQLRSMFPWRNHTFSPDRASQITSHSKAYICQCLFSDHIYQIMTAQRQRNENTLAWHRYTNNVKLIYEVMFSFFAWSSQRQWLLPVGIEVCQKKTAIRSF